MVKKLQITKKILATLKSEIVSATDIISRTELPYLLAQNLPNYIKLFGKARLEHYMLHQQKTDKIRSKAASLLPIYAAKGIPSPLTTIQVAITQCGVGECGETTNRAAVELVIKFSELGLETPVNIITTIGKAKVRLPKAASDYYSHAFVIIGQTPTEWDYSTGLNAFKQLSSDCILLDPSMGLIGSACDTEDLLKKIFDAYEINKISYLQVIHPGSYGAIAKEVLKNGKEIALVIKRELNLIDEVKPPTSAILSTEPLLPIHKKLLFNVKKNNQVLDFASTKRFEEDHLLSVFSIFTPKPTLLSEDSLSWEKSEQTYHLIRGFASNEA